MKKVLIVLLILILAFIWGNSCLSISESREESTAVMNLMSPLLEFLFGRLNITEHLVRKLAHFTEFAALGAVLALLIRMTWHGRLVCAVCGLLAGFLDETIQIFSGRGDQISDVWLDFAGALFGILTFSLLRFLYHRVKARRSRRNAGS